MGIFEFEDCLLKHHIRTRAWLPLCSKRREAIRSASSKAARQRPLRYFTFCAAGAIDVLMLDVESVIHPSAGGHFESVCFFDRTSEDVIETQKRIPGAVGFPGDFVSVVLVADPEEAVFVDDLSALESPPDQQDTEQTHSMQRLRAQHRAFIMQFPFDVVNLDLEGFLFKPNDPIPGQMVNCLRKICEWQRKPFEVRTGSRKTVTMQLEGFGLMFTTQVGPPNLGENYLGMLSDCVLKNLEGDASLRQAFRESTGFDDHLTLRDSNFLRFFELAAPKVLLDVLVEKDWYVDPADGISLYEIERESKDGPYRMLHLVMNVVKQSPALDRRPPGDMPVEVRTAYRDVVSALFSKGAVLVTEDIIEKDGLQQHLGFVKARAKKYSGEKQGGHRLA